MDCRNRTLWVYLQISEILPDTDGLNILTPRVGLLQDTFQHIPFGEEFSRIQYLYER